MNDASMSRSQATEDDFEFVPRQSGNFQEHDDLSSITSTAGETDAESETVAHDPQTDSNVTLRMPQVDRTSEYMHQAAESMLRHAKHELESSIVAIYPRLRADASLFNIGAKEHIELPIFYQGPEEFQDLILRKIADVLLPEFTSDVWHSHVYSCSYDLEGKAQVTAQSRISFRLVTNAEDIVKASMPVVNIRILADAITAEETDAEALPVEHQNLVDVPRLSLKGVESPPSSADSTESKDGEILMKGYYRSDSYCRRYLTVDEFDKLDQEEGSRLFMSCLDAWQDKRCSASASTWFENASSKIIPLISTKSISFVVLSMLIVTMLSLWTDSQDLANLTRKTWSANQIKFHQITETNALIELPAHYRGRPVTRLPDVRTTVTRDGKEIKSRVQVVLDNLYSLDWAHSEAHGELVVAAQVEETGKSLQDAYVIHYSAKTPFLHIIGDKLKDLNELGHMAEVDFSRRVQDLAKQIEESSSYAVNVSQHQLKYIKQHGSQSLKKFQAGVPVLLKPVEDIYDLLQAGSVVGKQQGLKQFENARHGVQRLQQMVGKNIPKAKNGLLATWSRSSVAKRLKQKKQKRRQK